MKHILLAIVFIYISGTCLAQGQQVNESFVIEKNKKLTLPTVQKQIFGDNQPVNITDLIKKSDQAIDTLSVWAPPSVDVTLAKSRFIPESFKRESHFSHLAWGSIGNRWATNAGYQFINAPEQKRRISALVQHHSLRVGPTDDQNSAQNGQASHFELIQPVKGWKIGFNSAISRVAFNYFGALDSLFDISEINQELESAILWRTAHRLSLTNAAVSKVKLATSVVHRSTNQANLSFNTEQHVGLTVNLHSAFTESLSWSVAPTIDFLRLNSAATSGDRMLAHIPVQVNYKKESWNLQGALNTAISSNVGETTQQTYFLPQLIFSYSLDPLQSIQLGLRSDASLQSAYELSSQNIYLDYAFNDYRSRINQSVWFLHYRNTFFSDHHLTVSADYTQSKDQAFFQFVGAQDSLLTPQQQARYQLTYDPKTTGQMNVRVAGQGAVVDGLSYNFFIQSTQYFLDSLSAAFHMPTFTSQWGLSYQISEKLNSSVQMRYDAGIQFSENEDKGQVANMNVNLTYQVNDQLQSYITCNNIFNQSNTRYYLYPSSPFLISVGLKALF